MRWCNAYVVVIARGERVDRLGGSVLVWERQVVGLGLTGGLRAQGLEIAESAS